MQFAYTFNADDIRVDLGTRRTHGRVHPEGDSFHVFHAGHHTVLKWLDPLSQTGELEGEGGKLTAPMPGKVIAVMVGPGSKVTKVRRCWSWGR